MRKLLLLLLFAAPVFSQQAPSSTGNITTSGSTCATTNACILLPLITNTGGTAVTVSGTWSGTLKPEQSADNGVTWSSAGSDITSNGLTTYTVVAITNFRVRASAFASGTALVFINSGATPGSAAGTINGVVVSGTPTTGQVPTATSSTTATWQTGGGGGGTPGGSTTQVQRNIAGAFGGISGATSDGTNLAVTTQAASDNSTNAASTAYVTTGISNAIAAVNPAVAVQAATAAVLPNSPTYANGASGVGATLTAGSAAALVVDGYTPILLDRILVKNQASAFQNGVYILSTLGTGIVPYILTRALDYDQPSDMNNTGSIPVVNGTVNTATSWLQTSTVTTVGTDAVTFTQFSINPANIATAFNPSTTVTFYDDFAGVTNGSPNWITDTGTMSHTTNLAGTYGVVTITSGTTSGNLADLYQPTPYFEYDNVAGWDHKSRFSISATTTISAYSGFGDDTVIGEGTTTGFGCVYDTVAGDTNLMYFMRKASGTATRVSSGVAATTGFHTCRVRSLVAGTWLFSIDGGAETCFNSGGTSGCTATSQQGSVFMSPMYGVTTRAASARALNVDYFWLNITGLTR